MCVGTFSFFLILIITEGLKYKEPFYQPNPQGLFETTIFRHSRPKGKNFFSNKIKNTIKIRDAKTRDFGG